jgi:sigma-E factor negative regulatory protein RseB
MDGVVIRHRERSEAIQGRGLPRLLCSLAMTGVFITAPAFALTPQQVIEKSQSASESLSFQGSFVHQQDSVLHTSKITQSRLGNDMVTRVQALEGFRQEVVRAPNETRTYWPDKKMVKIDQTGLKRPSFPNLFLGPAQQILANYEFKQAGTARIADLDALEFELTPRHAARWPIRIWVDKQSGLILKCQKFADAQRVVEQAAFTELSLVAKPVAVSLSPAYADVKKWKQHDASMVKLESATDLKYTAETLKGFEPVGVFERASNEGKLPGVRRYVFSDGIATVSVFIQPKSVAGPLTNKVRHRGALSMLSREMGESWITVMGDVPPEALSRFAQTIEWKN